VLEGNDQSQSASSEMWFHNGTSTPVGPLRLCCGALAAPSGKVLDARVGFDPPEISLLAARSSRGVVISLIAGRDPSPGVYRGAIQADGAPALWLPIEVAVQ
jgi:hypothetical protein